jgi:hypothetical protein
MSKYLERENQGEGEESGIELDKNRFSGLSPNYYFRTFN